MKGEDESCYAATRSPSYPLLTPCPRYCYAYFFFGVTFFVGFFQGLPTGAPSSVFFTVV